MNQLLALQAKQSIQSQRLQITQDRAASLELARQAAREVRRRFMGDGTPYTPQRVDFYATDGRPPCDRPRPVCALLAACSAGDRPADALAADPVRLKACARNARTGRPRARTLAVPPPKPSGGASGEAGPDEYQTLADLPPIPPSFDEPADGVAPAPPTEPEGTP